MKNLGMFANLILGSTNLLLAIAETIMHVHWSPIVIHLAISNFCFYGANRGRR